MRAMSCPLHARGPFGEVAATAGDYRYEVSHGHAPEAKRGTKASSVPNAPDN
jgi:hypothetical protein